MALVFVGLGRKEKKDLEEWVETGEGNLGVNWWPLELEFWMWEWKEGEELIVISKKQ